MQLRESRRHPDGRWSHAPLHEVSHRSAATGIGARARTEACGRIISTGRMLPSLHSGQRSRRYGNCITPSAWISSGPPVPLSLHDQPPLTPANRPVPAVIRLES
jgi:hypothetical protein